MKISNLTYIHALEENEVLFHKDTCHLGVFKRFKENKMSKEDVVLQFYFNNQFYERNKAMDGVKQSFINLGITQSDLSEQTLPILLEKIKNKFLNKETGEVELTKENFFNKNKQYVGKESFYLERIKDLVSAIEQHLNLKNTF